MRSVGSLTDQQLADRFAAYLDSQDIRSRVDEEGAEFVVWVIDEDKVDAAKTHFSEFVRTPDDPRFVEAVRKSTRVKTQQLEEALERRRQQFRKRRMPRQAGAPLTMSLVAVCLVVAALTRLGDVDIPFTRQLFMSDPKLVEQQIDLTSVQFRQEGNQLIIELPEPKGWDAIPEIRRGEVWRLFTPMFLHLSVLHLVFNMSWLISLGSSLEYLKGSRFLLLLIIFVDVVANVAELFSTGPVFGGMSGVVYGMFGFIWVRSKLVPEDGLHIEPVYIFLFLAWALICLSGAAGPVANAAHFGGLAAGAVIGALPVLSLRNPR